MRFRLRYYLAFDADAIVSLEVSPRIPFEISVDLADFLSILGHEWINVTKPGRAPHVVLPTALPFAHSE